MKYDWENIIVNQIKSHLIVKQYCKEKDIGSSSFYKAKRKYKEQSQSNSAFEAVKVVEHHQSNVLLTIDGHIVEFDSLLLDKVIGALK